MKLIAKLTISAIASALLLTAPAAASESLPSGTEAGRDPVGINGESSNLELSGRWAEGVCREVTSSGDTAFFGNGGRLDIVDFSNPSVPAVIGTLDLPTYIRGIRLSGDHLYLAADENELLIIDVSDPSTPILTGSTNTGLSAYDVDISGNYAYMAAGSAGIRVIDISDPGNPSEVAYFNHTGQATDIDIDGKYLYAAYGTYGLGIIDISNPLMPSETGWWETSDNVRDVDASGSFAYVADYGAGLRIIDVSVPSSPSLRDSVAIIYSYANAVTLEETHAYVSFGIKGMRIFNIKNPDIITLSGTFYEYYHNIYNTSVSGGKAYVAADTDGLKVLDVSNPESAGEIAVHRTAGYSQKTAVTGNYCFVSMGNEGFSILDISDLANPALVSSVDTLSSNGICIAGDYAYIAGGYDGIYVFDISMITAISFIGYYDTRGNAYDLTVSGSYAYVADGTEGLLILDVTDPASPDSTGSCPTAHIANGIALSGGYAYISDHGGGLRVVDISNPANPAEVDFYSGLDYANDVAISGNYAFVTDWSEGVRVFDISQPDNISLAGSRSYFIVEGITVSGNFAYVGAQSEGIRVLDISSAPAMSEPGYYDTGAGCLDICVTTDDFLIVSDGICGVYIMSNPLVSALVSSYGASAADGGIMVSWELSEPVPVEDITVLRQICGSNLYRLIKPSIRTGREGYSFTDRTCEPGRSYTYRVQLETGGEQTVLFESDEVSLPEPQPVLVRNYPNPFNPVTMVKYRIPHRSYVTLRVYDTEGRLVDCLVDGVEMAGWHEKAWNGTDRSGNAVSSGIYFCRLRAGKEESSAKMILLR